MTECLLTFLAFRLCLNSRSQTHNDEMCNFYLMYYTDARSGQSYYSCSDNSAADLIQTLPSDSDVPLPPDPYLDEIGEGVASKGRHVDSSYFGFKILALSLAEMVRCLHIGSELLLKSCFFHSSNRKDLLLGSRSQNDDSVYGDSESLKQQFRNQHPFYDLEDGALDEGERDLSMVSRGPLDLSSMGSLPSTRLVSPVESRKPLLIVGMVESVFSGVLESKRYNVACGVKHWILFGITSLWILCGMISYA